MANGQHETMVAEDDVPEAVKRVIIQQDIQMWINSRYQAQVRLRVQKAIGDTEQQAAIIRDLERCERALDALAAELAAVPADEP